MLRNVLQVGFVQQQFPDPFHIGHDLPAQLPVAFHALPDFLVPLDPCLPLFLFLQQVLRVFRLQLLHQCMFLVLPPHGLALFAQGIVVFDHLFQIVLQALRLADGQPALPDQFQHLRPCFLQLADALCDPGGHFVDDGIHFFQNGHGLRIVRNVHGNGRRRCRQVIDDFVDMPLILTAGSQILFLAPDHAQQLVQLVLFSGVPVQGRNHVAQLAPVVVQSSLVVLGRPDLDAGSCQFLPDILQAYVPCFQFGHLSLAQQDGASPQHVQICAAFSLGIRRDFPCQVLQILADVLTSGHLQPDID